MNALNADLTCLAASVSEIEVRGLLSSSPGSAPEVCTHDKAHSILIAWNVRGRPHDLRGNTSATQMSQATQNAASVDQARGAD